MQSPFYIRAPKPLDERDTVELHIETTEGQRSMTVATKPHLKPRFFPTKRQLKNVVPYTEADYRRFQL